MALGGQFGGQNGVQVALGGQFEGQVGVQVALGGQLEGPRGAKIAPRDRKKASRQAKMTNYVRNYEFAKSIEKPWKTQAKSMVSVNPHE